MATGSGSYLSSLLQNHSVQKLPSLQPLTRLRTSACYLAIQSVIFRCSRKIKYDSTDMSPKSSMNFVIIAGVIGNVLSVVGIVICNKYITEVDGYNFMVFLSFLHFAFTMMGTRAMLFTGMFQFKEAPISGILPVAIGSLLSVAFMNLNLSNNSVGFYQLSKLACIPFTLFVQYVAYNQSVPRSVQLTLIPISVGVGYATIYDLNLNLVGTGELTIHFYPYLFSFVVMCWYFWSIQQVQSILFPPPPLPSVSKLSRMRLQFPGP